MVLGLLMMLGDLQHIISIEKCVVVIDTNVARELGESSGRPGWVDTFARMISSREYSFVLADGTFTALLHQITKKLTALWMINASLAWFKRLWPFSTPNIRSSSMPLQILTLIRRSQTPMSKRCDLPIRYLYRQGWVRIKKTKCA